MTRQIDAIFFDMGGTIETFWHTRELRLQATGGLHEILLRAGIDLDTEQLYTLVTEGLARYRRWTLQSMIELPPEQVWREYILTHYPSARQQLNAAVAEDLTFFIETKYYHRQMRPEMPNVLEAIQELGLKMGVISNVQSRGQVHSNLEQYGIKHFFDPIVTSSAYGRRKPDPAIFYHAAQLMNVPAGACAHVGDRISRDILGARKAGYRLAVQIHHEFGGKDEVQDAAPDAVLTDMTELVDVLKDALRHPARTPVASRDERGLRAILFDAGDILYFRPNKGRRLNAFLGELGLDPAKPSLADKQALKTRAFCKEISQDAYREGLLKLYGVRGQEQIERGKQVLEEEDNAVQFFDGVKDTLIALREQGFFLGIITDTAQPASVKLRWFDRAGIAHVWDTVISSCDLGVSKPDPRIYHAALRQLSVRPDEAVFVGHKISELDGANAVGMTTVAFNYDAGARADFYIEHLGELLALPIISDSDLTSCGEKK
jgi:putative hydrolase of the HAD superfamily